MDFPGGSVVENPLAKQETWDQFLSGEFHEQWSLEGYSPWGLKELDTTEGLNSNMRAYFPVRPKFF